MANMPDPSALEANFIQLLRDTNVLLIGDFVLKSGKRSSYFANFGAVGSGDALFRLGQAFATKIVRDIGVDAFDVLFGPATKGIPIALATAIALHQDYGVSKGFSFNRTSAKDHGEGCQLVGQSRESASRVLNLDDVITDGGTKFDTIDLLKSQTACVLVGVLVGIDRTENPQISEQFVQRAGIPLWSIVSAEHIQEIATLRHA